MPATTTTNGHAVTHPIQQYISLLQSSRDNGSTNALVLKALSDPAVYSGFAEIRALPAVQQLNSSGKSLTNNTLDLFSYGTYRDYSTAAEGTYAGLTDKQLAKLKALTVVSVVHQNCDPRQNGTGSIIGSSPQSRRSKRRSQQQQDGSASTTAASCGIVPYSALQAELGLSNSQNSAEIRQLEDLLIHCIYSNLLPSGTKLDQKNMCLVVKLSQSSSQDSSRVLCRDVNLEKDLPDMIEKLEVFYKHGKEVKAKLEQSLNQLQKDAHAESEEWNQIDLQMQLAKAEVGSGAGEKGARFPEMSGAAMEWGASPTSGRQGKRSRGGNGKSRGFLGLGAKRG